jgi:hypothetical protein
VKVVQSWARSPLFQFVPEEHRASALETVPWRSEPLIYQSDLAARLPAGLTMPRAYAVIELDDESAALWLEAVDAVPAAWDVEHLAHAAYLLGRLAASPDVRGLARVGDVDGKRTVRAYAEGRVALQVVPALRNDDVWNHPLVAATFDDQLRKDLLRAADALPDIVDELETMPIGTSHGDACTRNLLVSPATTDLVLIDYGFWGEAPIGFDLSQLLLGEVQMGERSATCLPELEATCLPAYFRGLHDESYDIPLARPVDGPLLGRLRRAVRAPRRRAHAGTAAHRRGAGRQRSLHPRPARRDGPALAAGPRSARPPVSPQGRAIFRHLLDRYRKVRYFIGTEKNTPHRETVRCRPQWPP